MRGFSIFCCYILILLLGFILPIHAGQWGDTFEQEELEGWDLLLPREAAKNWESEWKTRGGMLDVTIKRVKNLRIAEFLQWIVRSFDAEALTVTVHSIKSFRVNRMPEGRFGVFLGEKFPKGHADFASGYLFLEGFVCSIRFSKDGRYEEVSAMAAFFRRAQLKILFQAGHFRLFSEDVLLTEFEDPELTQINAIGLLALTNGVADEFHGQVDTFTISGPHIPNNNFVVQAKGKLATVWGKLKGL